MLQVHVVGAESAEGCVDLLHDRLARQAAVSGAVADFDEHLGCQHDFVAMGEAAQRLAAVAQSRRMSRRCGVPEGDALVERLLEEREGVTLPQRPRGVRSLGRQLMHPRAMRLTFRPELPSRVYFMVFLSVRWPANGGRMRCGADPFTSGRSGASFRGRSGG